MDRPPIAITMGDPAGVGPEVCLRAASDSAVLARCVPLIFGNAALLRRVGEQLGLPVPEPTLEWPLASDSAGFSGQSEAAIVECAPIDAASVRPGALSADCGRAAYAAIDAAIDAAQAGQVAAVATAPINKEALHAAGYAYPGHTEIFAERDAADRACMMQTSEKITVSFATTHVGYAQVPAHLSRERIVDTIELTAEAMRRIRGRAPRLLVCGLNPHAGEHGLFGDGEEERLIAPAVEDARRSGHDIEGPLPPDTVFVPARLAQADAIICMYHDQGHIPLKMLAFNSAVNTTLGLRIIRTSVDHGTAFDIAWTGQANPGSLIQAILLATRLAQRDEDAPS